MINDSILQSEKIAYMNPLIRSVDSRNVFDRWFFAKKNDPATVERIKKQHDFHITIVKKLYEAGVTILCGTDAGIGITVPGFSVHKELSFYKEAGLSNFEILKTATVNAAQTHNLMDKLGTIEEGILANILILDDNPIANLNTLRDPKYVFTNGRKLNKAMLKSFKQKARNRSNLVPSAVQYIEDLLIEK